MRFDGGSAIRHFFYAGRGVLDGRTGDGPNVFGGAWHQIGQSRALLESIVESKGQYNAVSRALPSETLRRRCNVFSERVYWQEPRHAVPRLEEADVQQV